MAASQIGLRGFACRRGLKRVDPVVEEYPDGNRVRILPTEEPDPSHYYRTDDDCQGGVSNAGKGFASRHGNAQSSM